MGRIVIFTVILAAVFCLAFAIGRAFDAAPPGDAQQDATTTPAESGHA